MKHIIRLFILIAALVLGTDHAWADAESNPRVNFVYVDGDNYALTSDKGFAFASDETTGEVTITVNIFDGQDYRCIEGDLTAEQSINSNMGQARRRTSAEGPGNGVSVPVTCTNTNEFTLTLPDDESTNVTVYVKFSEKAPLTVTANDMAIDFGEEANNDGVFYSDFEGDDDESVLEGTLSFSYGTTDGGVFSEYQAGDPVGDYQIIPSGLTSADYKITFVPGTLTVNLTNIVTQDNFYSFFYENGELRDNVTFDELIFQDEFSDLVSYITLDRPITITGYKKNTGDTENTDDKAILNDIAFLIAADGITLNNMKLVANSNLGNLIGIAGENTVISNMDISYTVDEAASAINVYPGANGTQIVNNKIYFESNVDEYAVDEVTTAICVNSGVSIFDDEDPIEDLVIVGNEITAVIPAFLADIYENEYYVMGLSAVNGVRINGAKNFQFTNNTLNVTTNWLYRTTPTFQGMYVASSSGLIDGNDISMIDEFTPAGKDVYLYGMELIKDEDLTIFDNDFNISTTGGKEEAGSACAILAIESNFSISDNTITTESKGPNYAVYFPSNMGAPCDAVISDNTIKVTGLATSAHDTGLVSGIEIETGNVEISGNTICTYNIGEYAEGNYIYGISYAQDGIKSNWTITDNTIYTEGKYAISLKSADDAEITENALCAHELFGDDAVNIADGDENTVDNNILGYVMYFMPKTGENTYNIPANVSSFKVFDNGGKGRIYSPSCDGTLTLTAPTGYVLQLSGNITTEEDEDYLTVYDGNSNQADVLIDQVSSSASGTLTDIPTVISTGQSITLYFYSDNSVSDISEYDGLDLTVSLISSTATLFAADATNKWMTWCDKYAYVKPEGVTVYTVSSVATDKVTLAEVSGDVIPAYTPVILYRAAAGEDAVTATFSAVGTAPASGYNAANGICSQSNQAGTFTFFGATTAMAKIPDNDFTYYNGGLTYVLYGDKFLKSDSNNGIAANRCWLKLQAGGGTGPVNARQLVIVVDDDATAIADRQLSTVNSQLNEWYTLDGRKLSGKPTKKGLYIYNGKKTVVK